MSTKAVLCRAQSCLTFPNPMNCSWPGSSVHGDSPGKNTGGRCQAFLQGIFPSQGLNPGLPLNPVPPTLQADSLSSESPGKPHYTAVGSLSLLQGIFQTQELNQGVLHCKQILNQLIQVKRSFLPGET